MEHVTLRRRVYGPMRSKLLSMLRNEIKSLLGELNVSVQSFQTDERGRVIVTMSGDDEEFAKNLIIKEYGSCVSWSDLVCGIEYPAQLVDVDRFGYGLYADIGLLSITPKDALIPLHRLRAQTGLKGHSVRSITRTLVLVNDLPLTLNVVSVSPAKGEVEGALGESFLARLRKWSCDEHERVLAIGVLHEVLERVLEAAGHREDVRRIEKLGPYEFSLVCKRSTRASGIIAAIGDMLKGVPLHAFLPEKVRSLWPEQ